MRLSEDKIKHGILHSEQKVRDTAVRYFSICFSTDPTVMPRVIEAIQQYGWRNGVSNYALGDGLSQTDETLQWIIGELRREEDADEGWISYQFGLTRLLSQANPQLLEEHEVEIQSIEGLDLKTRETISDRIRLLAADAETCWQELQAFCEQVKTAEYISDVDLGPAYNLVEAIARAPGEFADRMMSVLQEKIEDFTDHPMAFMEPLTVRLAGEMRLQAAVPLVIGKLREDADWLSEECKRALKKIGSDGVVKAIAEDFPKADWSFRLYSAAVLEGIHSDLCVESCLNLLRQEKDKDIQTELGQAALSHFADEVVEPVRQLILHREMDSELLHLEENLVTTCTLMEVDFPELERWKEETRDTTAWRRKLLAQKCDLPPIAGQIEEDFDDKNEAESDSKPKIGRNDPCPCGSGKKYKKCCMRQK